MNNINNKVINALSECLPLNFLRIKLCNGENNTAKVMAHKIGSKNGLSKIINAKLAAIKSVKKKICLIKINAFYAEVMVSFVVFPS